MVHPLVAAVQSAVLPGWGQYRQGRRRTGLNMFRVVVVLLTILVAAYAAGSPSLVALVVRPEVLVLLIAFNLGVLAFRAFSVWDAYRSAGGESFRHAGPTATTVVLAAILVGVTVPHVAAGYYSVQAYDLLTSLFQGPASPSGGWSAGPGSSPGTGGGDPGTTVPTTAPAPATTTIPWQGEDRLNLLLLGGDAGPGRDGMRTDTMIVASIGLEEGAIALFGLPRNLAGAPLPGGGTFDAYQGILNEVYPWGLNNPGRFPDAANPGAAAIMGVAEEILGIAIDYYLLVNLEAFIDLVDALGGVDMVIPGRVYDDAYPHEDGTTEVIDIPAGEQHLDGHLALAYVRSRQQSDDYARMGRQRCLLVALAAQADVPSLLRAFPELVPIIKQGIDTDIPVEALPHLVELAGKVEADDALVVGLGPPDWTVGLTQDGFPLPDLAKIHTAVQVVIHDPDQARELYDLSGAGSECGWEQP
ncbi:MAG: LCP family protein, partial [Acidimicrobiia bacterium]